MKIVAASNGKKTLKLSKSDWKIIGEKAGWITEAKKKKKKDLNPNPWAVCHTTVDKEKDPEKYEKCVMDVKEKQE
jgi:hypothetical protein